MIKQNVNIRKYFIYVHIHISKKYKLNFDINIVINFIDNLILLNNYQIAIFLFLFFFFFTKYTKSGTQFLFSISKNIKLQKFIVKHDIFSVRLFNKL